LFTCAHCTALPTKLHACAHLSNMPIAISMPDCCAAACVLCKHAACSAGHQPAGPDVHAVLHCCYHSGYCVHTGKTHCLYSCCTLFHPHAHKPVLSCSGCFVDSLQWSEVVCSQLHRMLWSCGRENAVVASRVWPPLVIASMHSLPVCESMLLSLLCAVLQEAASKWPPLVTWASGLFFAAAVGRSTAMW
jgi:hypothetical protein